MIFHIIMGQMGQEIAKVLQTNQIVETPYIQKERPFLSIVIPTFNEADNIVGLLKDIRNRIPKDTKVEILIVDDDSPDGTGSLVEAYIQNDFNPKRKVLDMTQHNNQIPTVRVIHRQRRDGLIPALLNGINSSSGKNILVMDADFSHPPQLIPTIINELKHEPNCVVIGSRYAKGGSIVGMSFRRLILSVGATRIARHGLKVKHVRDPMSGFFAFPREILNDIKINSQGFKILLEILVKKQKHIMIKEIPYTFTVRKYGQSKLDLKVVLNYTKAVWGLYMYGRRSQKRVENMEEHRRSVLFLSKAARFFTVGASGLLINLLISILLSNGTLASLWYVQATAIGIAVSITTNFVLNKIWTFEDRKFSLFYMLKQYGLFLFFSSLGISIQLTLVYSLVESGISYNTSLICAVAAASISNFLLNKKWTFRERVWG
jgi:dolichol-phosphate mannosyltransferase